MSGRRIIKVGQNKFYQFGEINDKVEEKCKEVHQINQAIHAFVETMKDFAAQQGFVSVSANQLNKSYRLFVALKQQSLIPGKWNGYEELVMAQDYEAVFNAQVTGSSPYHEYSYEECSSIPMFKFKVRRPIICKIKWNNQLNQRFHEELSGFRLRVWQHQLSHMEGRLLTQLSSDVDLTQQYRDTLHDQQFSIMKDYLNMIRQTSSVTVQNTQEPK